MQRSCGRNVLLVQIGMAGERMAGNEARKMGRGAADYVAPLMGIEQRII